jgi:hypothetical protein
MIQRLCHGLCSPPIAGCSRVTHPLTTIACWSRYHRIIGGYWHLYGQTAHHDLGTDQPDGWVYTCSLRTCGQGTSYTHHLRAKENQGIPFSMAGFLNLCGIRLTFPGRINPGFSTTLLLKAGNCSESASHPFSRLSLSGLLSYPKTSCFLGMRSRPWTGLEGVGSSVENGS